VRPPNSVYVAKLAPAQSGPLRAANKCQKANKNKTIREIELASPAIKGQRDTTTPHASCDVEEDGNSKKASENV
jgi:hypothetical protein